MYLRIGPKLITASALDSIAVLPEGKGNRRVCAVCFESTVLTALTNMLPYNCICLLYNTTV